MATEANNSLWKFDLHQIPEMIQYTEYKAPAGHYDWHADIGPGLLSNRKVSITVQLSEPDEYEGGNLLEGVKKLRGLEDFLDYSWSFKNDPYFSQGLLACKEISNNKPIQGSALDQEHFHFFSNQSAFMLLWTIIERFCSIKYGNLSPTEKLKKLTTFDNWFFTFGDYDVF